MTATRLVITGTWVTETDTPASGRIQFQANDVGFVNGGELVRAGVQGYALDKTGSINVSLIRCPDGYTVTEQINGAYKRSYILPDQVGPVDLRDVIVTPTGINPAALVAAEAVLRQQGDIAEQDAREAQFAALESELPDTYVPIAGLTAEIAAREAGDAALDTRVDALEAGGGGGGALAVTVPYWDHAHPASIYHGAFWPLGADLGPFEWEAWVRHDTGAEYWISEGFGGAHAILAGFGTGVPTGNVWDGTASHSFSGAYTAQNGEHLHYRVMWDGTTIWVLINGIVVGSFAFAGPRRAQYGDLLIGGSDHSNWQGCIVQERAWEGQAPHTPWIGYNNPLTERHFLDRTTSSGPLAQFVTNYLDNADVFPDLGDGFAGELHPGAIRGAYNGFGFEGLAPHPQRVVDPTAPFGNQMNVARTRTPAAAVAVPTGAKIWDSYGGPDTNWAWVATPSLGNTEGGSLGVKTWAHTAGYWARFDGSAVCGFFYDFARVATNSADMDVRVGRLVDAAKGFYYVSAAARIKADRSTGWAAYTTSATTVALFRPDGTQAGSWTPGTTTWTHLRLLTAGTTITVYTGTSTEGPWTQIGQVTGETANQAEVGAGKYHYYGIGTASRYTDFHVAA